MNECYDKMFSRIPPSEFDYYNINILKHLIKKTKSHIFIIK